MKAWQLTTGLAVLAIAAGQLPQFVVDDGPPIRARLDRVVGDADYGFVGPEDRPTLSPAAVNATLRARRDLRDCFFDGGDWMQFTPDEVVLGFHVLPDGSVERAGIQLPAGLRGSPLDRCVTRELELVRFPPSEGNDLWVSTLFTP
jgi:hypothetical protein